MTRGDSELALLHARAKELAAQRGERLTSGHLLAALASSQGPAAALLLDRRLDEAVLARAARVGTDDARDAIERSIAKARELAARPKVGAGTVPRGTRVEASGLHLLVALCQDATCAAHRTLVQVGVDVAKLRVAALGVLSGLAVPRRASAPAPANASRLAPPVPVSSRPPASSTPVIGAPVRKPPVATPVKPSAPPSSFVAPRRAAPTKPASPETLVGGKRRTPPAPRRGAGAGPGGAMDARREPTLSAVGRDLTALARTGELGPVVGRDALVDRVLDVLGKREENAPLLVGAPGAGKSAVVRALAQRVADGHVPGLEAGLVLEIEPSTLLAGALGRGQLAERLAQIRGEAARSERPVLLVLEDLAGLVSEGGEEAASELKLGLGRGELRCVATIAPEELRRLAERDPSLVRRFVALEVSELGEADAREALTLGLPLLEHHHGVAYDPAAVARAVEWSVRYLPGRTLPGKAAGLLDLAGARARRAGDREVSLERLAETCSAASQVPAERLLETDGARLLALEASLGERVVGHAEHLARIARVLRRNASGFRSQRPVGTFLLLGPTGVGKTETAKAIAECLFDSDQAMTRLDMSEYAEPHAIARLVGAPPGYLGHDAGGQLTEAVRRRPYQVVLLDEIEKAHRDVLEAFLQVFDEGRLTDGRGRTVDLTNVVVILTSNLGAAAAAGKVRERGRIGFGRTDADDEARERRAREDAVVAAARAELPPELYNRLDEVLAFAPLGRAEVGEVARRLARRLSRDLEAARGVRLELSDAAVDVLLDRGGYDPELGARPMRRTIGRLVETPIAEMVLRGELAAGDLVRVRADGEGLAFEVAKARAA